ncbi:hypothetical protein SDC9_162597 [bioreactor metagenome]|uniref:Uncharacterized protein n=1 Tax=bioreactor metagenome TaxID=1076179 RepID=A0A645FLH6_9ZZZZ
MKHATNICMSVLLSNFPEKYILTPSSSTARLLIQNIQRVIFTFKKIVEAKIGSIKEASRILAISCVNER